MRVFRCTITAMFVAMMGAAHADTTTLFYEGLELLEKKQDYPRACAKFRQAYAESQQAREQNPGIEANVGMCAERDGDLPAAWRHYTSAARQFEGDGTDRAVQMRAKADAVAKRATVVVIGVPAPTLPGLEITVNGTAVEPARSIRELVMPGEITIAATAKDKQPWQRSELGKAGESIVVEVVLDDVRRDPGAPPPAANPERRRRRGWIYASIGAGVTGAGALVTSFFVARAAKADYDAILANPMYCMNGDCNPEGLRRVDDTQDRAMMATAIGIGGGVLAVGAVVLFVMAPKDTVVTPVATADSIGFTLAKRFW